MEAKRVVGMGGEEEGVAMRIHLVEAPAEPWQITEMLVALGDYIKTAVDVERRILAGGGKYHADCEEVLLEAGACSRIFGAPGGSHRPARFDSKPC